MKDKDAKLLEEAYSQMYENYTIYDQLANVVEMLQAGKIGKGPIIAKLEEIQEQVLETASDLRSWEYPIDANQFDIERNGLVKEIAD